jgi:hypothetical protein
MNVSKLNREKGRLAVGGPLNGRWIVSDKDEIRATAASFQGINISAVYELFRISADGQIFEIYAPSGFSFLKITEALFCSYAEKTHRPLEVEEMVSAGWKFAYSSQFISAEHPLGGKQSIVEMVEPRRNGIDVDAIGSYLAKMLNGDQ